MLGTAQQVEHPCELPAVAAESVMQHKTGVWACCPGLWNSVDRNHSTDRQHFYWTQGAVTSRDSGPQLGAFSSGTWQPQVQGTEAQWWTRRGWFSVPCAQFTTFGPHYDKPQFNVILFLFPDFCCQIEECILLFPFFHHFSNFLPLFRRNLPCFAF